MSVKAFSASGYQNECSVQTACLNAFCASGPQEIAKLTSSGPFVACGSAACPAGGIDNPMTANAVMMIPKRMGAIGCLPQGGFVGNNVRDLPGAALDQHSRPRSRLFRDNAGVVILRRVRTTPVEG